MKKLNNKKEKIFELFSQNLAWVKEHPSISFNPDFEKGYVCPLCFDAFFEKDLAHSAPNPLTIEHIPPESLGGKPLVLTCKNCNSKSGHELDAHLLKHLLEEDAHALLPSSKTKATFELNGNKVNGVVEVDDKGEIKFDLQPQRSHPDQSRRFMKDLLPPQTIYNPIFNSDNLFESGVTTAKFRVSLSKYSKERRAEVALLRIAYLKAFSTLGNGFYINPGLYKVREQILNPDKEILPKVFWIHFDFPKELEGINIISLPKELRCYLVIFTLKTQSLARRFAIALPGPTDPGVEVYDYIANNLCVGDGTAFVNGMIEHIPDTDYLRVKKYTFASLYFWGEYTKEDYQPRLPPE
ncbi:HNH endonuclease [Paradesertivirga mongoliensis]|uniref:HNH endonuclease n=1 Tax=Paradesertivirga mongoliensis TaxID=2100740 RepID=A0ABW4ZRJ7_9SPHI|nr:HNH endonuclease [Pedobacter mongoliensis]